MGRRVASRRRRVAVRAFPVCGSGNAAISDHPFMQFDVCDFVGDTLELSAEQICPPYAAALSGSADASVGPTHMTSARCARV